MTGPDDLELVRDLGSDDPNAQRRALGALFERHHRRVFHVAYRVLGDWSRAHDVTQDVFLHLTKRIHTYRGEASLASWIYRVTVNRAIDSRRREARRPAWRLGDAGPDLPDPKARSEEEVPVRGEEMDRATTAGRVQEALGRLSPKLRAILVLRYLEGLSYDELASVLDCSMGTVKSRLSRAHEAMERALGGTDPQTQGE